MQRKTHGNYIWEVVLVIATGLVLYIPALTHFYFADDYAWLETGYRATREPALIWNYRLFGYWRPVITLSFTLEFLVFGSSSLLHHLSNIILHIVNSLLMYGILRRVFTRRIPVLFGAALFAVSPAGNEAVIWISGRTDVLSTTFYLAALLAYIRSLSFSPGAFILLAFACLTKESAVTWPVLAFIVSTGPQGEKDELNMRKRIIRLVPYLVLILFIFSVYAITAAKLPGSFPDNAPSRTLSVWLMNVLGGTVYTLLPVSHLYAWSRYITEIGILILFIIWMYACFNRKEYAPLKGLLITMVLIVPAAFTPYQFLPKPWMTFQRFFYLPAIGASLFWAGILNALKLAERYRRNAALLGLAFILGLAASSTLGNMNSWRRMYDDQIRLMIDFRKELSAVPANSEITVLCPDKQVWTEQLRFFADREIKVITDPEGYKPRDGELVYMYSGGSLIKIH